jgi:hypothetical protein
VGRVFLVVGVPTVARKMDFVLKCVTLTNPAYGGPSQVGGSPAFSGFWYRVASLLGWFRAFLLPYTLYVHRLSAENK